MLERAINPVAAFAPYRDAAPVRQPEQKRRRMTIMDPIMDPVDLGQARRTKGLIVRTLNDGSASS
jgi:hypothetical protein